MTKRSLVEYVPCADAHTTGARLEEGHDPDRGTFRRTEEPRVEQLDAVPRDELGPALSRVSGRRYWLMMSSTEPWACTRPARRNRQELQSDRRAPTLWLTNTTVGSAAAIDCILPMHFCWNCASPTASNLVDDEDVRIQVCGDSEG
jgi:hypothetical protein